jgi:hypothetical protein
LRVANELWARVDNLNRSLADALNRLSDLYGANEKAYIAGVRYVNSVQPVQVRVVSMDICVLSLRPNIIPPYFLYAFLIVVCEPYDTQSRWRRY